MVAAPDSARASTPAPVAVLMANGSGSIPATSQPEAIASRAASWPSSPRPSTTTLAPGPAPDRRSACSGMDASVANAASCAGHPLRHGGAQQAGHGLELGVAGLARAAGRDQLAGLDPGDGGADLDRHPGRGVAERDVGGEPAADRPRGGRDALGLGLAHGLADQVRPGPRLGKQARPGQRGDRRLGARGDHRGHGAHKHLGLADHRAGHLEYLDVAAADRLHDLLHVVPAPS